VPGGQPFQRRRAPARSGAGGGCGRVGNAGACGGIRGERPGGTGASGTPVTAPRGAGVSYGVIPQARADAGSGAPPESGGAGIAGAVAVSVSAAVVSVSAAEAAGAITAGFVPVPATIPVSGPAVPISASIPDRKSTRLNSSHVKIS